MSRAQGALPKESKTATIYESIQGGENKSKTELRSKEDEGGIQVDRLEDKVKDPTGEGGPIFGSPSPNNDDNQDLGIIGTA
ncbi:hypothetical protein ERO13_A11G192300v2 [Gossypium hirsutum]|uniref:Seed maturation protein PM41 n=1 Tax=Gossypium hirsutum TaxID=3635 RepID=A0ABM2Z459_GOSHI|nr:uncharacterized protein LOC121209849 [Gossypium hirsutum]KAG4175561.1 hypothetical protein ERO13_A11G192300v2 [Gossypium hirsutum]